ncbi:MAG: short-chain-enoyl-CoA hydratase [Ignavibacteriales bacterium]
MEFKNIILEKEGPLAIVFINRPQAMNALNQETLQELETAVDSLAADKEVTAVIVTGSGEKAFVAGADIAFMQPLGGVEGKFFGELGQRVFRKIEEMPKPVIAAVNGFALGGGCELAMACDIRVASVKAKFGQPEVGLGITPGFGGTQRLPRLVGEGMAKEMIYTADVIDANEALRIGLVNHVVAVEELMDYCKTMAGKIMAKAPLAVRFSKQCINEGMQTDIDRGLTIEADLFGLCFSTNDQKEGMQAFAEKRKYNFQGK